MHNISNDLKERYERQMKAKIYRQMLDEQVRYKNIIKQERVTRNQDRFKTQPIQRKYNQLNQEENMYSNEKFPPLRQESIFLPILESKRIDSTKPRYLEVPKSYETLRNQYSYQDASEDDQAQKYLNQCEQIIGSLRELTTRKKSQRKMGKSLATRKRSSLVYTPIKEVQNLKAKLPVSYNGNESQNNTNDFQNEKEAEITNANVFDRNARKSKSRIMVKSKQKPSRFYGSNNQYENEFVDDSQTIGNSKSPRQTFNPRQMEKSNERQSIQQQNQAQQQQQFQPKVIQSRIVEAKRVNKYEVEPIRSRASSPFKAISASKMIDQSDLRKSKSPKSNRNSNQVKYDIDLKSQDEEIKEDKQDEYLGNNNSRYKTISHSPGSKEKENDKYPPKSSNRLITFAPEDQKEKIETSTAKANKKKNKNQEELGTTAMLNYLKKAKLRGKQLYEKIESFKKERRGGQQVPNNLINAQQPATAPENGNQYLNANPASK